MNTARKKISEKFKEQVEYLISEGIVASQQEIVDNIGWNKSQMSQAMKGIKPIPLPVYRKFTTYYKLPQPSVEVNDITDDLYRDKYITSLEKQVASMEAHITLVTGELRHLTIMNHALLLTLRDAAAELMSNGSKSDLLKVADRLDTKTAEYYRQNRKMGNLIGGDS